MNNQFVPSRGLLGQVDHTTRSMMESGIEVSFMDVYDAVDLAWENVRALETAVSDILYGADTETLPARMIPRRRK